jgi:hypothetical protein
MTPAPERFEPQRLPAGWFLLATAICFALSFCAVQSSSRDVVQATAHIPPGQCGKVWLHLIGGCRGLVLLQLAGSQASAQTVVNAIRDSSAVNVAVRSVQLDYLLILSYVAFLVFLAATVAGLRGLRDITWVRRVLSLVASLQGVAGVLDGLENVGLFAMLAADNVAPGVAEWTFLVSSVKWWLLGVGFVAPVLALIAWPFLLRRRSAERAGAGG